MNRRMMANEEKTLRRVLNLHPKPSMPGEDPPPSPVQEEHHNNVHRANSHENPFKHFPANSSAPLH